MTNNIEDMFRGNGMTRGETRIYACFPGVAPILLGAIPGDNEPIDDTEEPKQLTQNNPEV